MKVGYLALLLFSKGEAANETLKALLRGDRTAWLIISLIVGLYFLIWFLRSSARKNDERRKQAKQLREDS